MAAYDADEGTRQRIADRFKVSLGLVKKLLAQRKELGTIEPGLSRIFRTFFHSSFNGHGCLLPATPWGGFFYRAIRQLLSTFLTVLV